MTEKIKTLLQRGKYRDMPGAVNDALESGISADKVLQSMVEAMDIIGEKFKNGDVYIPEVLIAAKAMTAGIDTLKPHLSSSSGEDLGKVIVCTVKGDTHDIGKNLVKIMIEGKGIECIDLGTNVDGLAVVNAVKEHGAKVVCLSALLTTTMNAQGEIIEALKQAGIRDSVTVVVGGAPVNEAFAKEIGADKYTEDAASCAQYVYSVLKGE